MHVLVTGGAGFIGSHTVLELLQAGHRVTVLDNLCNSSEESLRRVRQLAGRECVLLRGDVRDEALLGDLFAREQIDAVLHFAGLKAVGDSMRDPLGYYDSNLNGSLTLLRAMAAAGVWRLVFSSSATVYGEPSQVPLDERCPTREPANPYGRSKLMIEQVLQDLCRAEPRWSVGLLRYFNPVGAHPSGLIGEDPLGVPNNLLPYICQVAVGQRAQLTIHGDDYPTADGTCLRDYVHVVDLARGHVQALSYLSRSAGCQVWNLGTGVGHSVLQVVRTFEQVSGLQLPFVIGPRRDGDIAANWADPRKAARELGWRAEFDLARMLTDAWRWQSQNPQGYR